MLVALLAVVGGAFAVYFFCVLPYRCNRIVSVQAAATQYALVNAGSPEGKIAARRNLAALWPCTAPTCRDVGTDMLVAANYRVLGQPAEAIRLYRHALSLDHRPEIYLNLAEAELAVGDRTAAHENFLRAALFNPWTLRSIDDGLLRQQIVQQLVALWPENADYVRYIDAVQLP